MRSASAHGVLLLALALASCRDDSTSLVPIRVAGQP